MDEDQAKSKSTKPCRAKTVKPTKRASTKSVKKAPTKAADTSDDSIFLDKVVIESGWYFL